jgi:tetratricopeptide (TPR) repeat protein
LLALDPGNPSYRNLRAAALARLGEFDTALEAYRTLLADHPRQPKGWMSYGHALKTVGRTGDAIAAYREALAQAPTLGEAWWSLANLKTVRFDAADVAAMTAALTEATVDDDRLHLEFALGKAAADRGAAAAAFGHYAEGNRLRAAQVRYDPAETTRAVARARAFFTAELLRDRAGQGCPDADPIFIVGMPRSGSTLIEQILASHSAVEGTTELPDLPALAWAVGARTSAKGETAYPEALADLTAADLAALGRDYLDRTRPQRKTDRPRFIDKLPNNWLHVGLIRLILPGATIIDARRHPLACGWSNFTQHYARGQGFSYSLDTFGRYYRDYADLMAHFDAVAPGAVHRVDHAAMVADTEATVRALLAHCRLPFEPACLRFWETERAIRTPSSEQVRRPIFDGGAAWRAYDEWLGPLRTALGPVLASEANGD